MVSNQPLTTLVCGRIYLLFQQNQDQLHMSSSHDGNLQRFFCRFKIFLLLVQKLQDHNWLQINKFGMSKKENKKQNYCQSSKLLYLKLKQSLSLEKANISLALDKISLPLDKNAKTKRKLIGISKKQIKMSQSLSLNDAILQNQQETYRLNNFSELSKQKINLSKNGQTSYQRRSKSDKISMGQKFPNKFFYYQSQKNIKQKVQKSNEIKKHRIHNFFKINTNKKAPEKNFEDTMTYSLILKNLDAYQNGDEHHVVSPMNGIDNGIINFKKCQNCNHRMKTEPDFFKNQQIKKNIQQIIMQGNQLNETQKADFRHFPEVQVLNHTYFNEKQKNLITKLNSNSSLSQDNKMQMFLSRRKSADCNKCKTCQKSKENKQNKFSTTQSNFQYFVYEYRTTGTFTQKNSNKLSPKSRQYMKRTRNITEHKNINHSQSRTTKNLNLSVNSTFEDFIKHNKIQVPIRPYTAAVKQATQIFHRKPFSSKGIHSRKAKCEQNFLKPWENSAEVDNFF